MYRENSLSVRTTKQILTFYKYADFYLEKNRYCPLWLLSRLKSINYTTRACVFKESFHNSFVFDTLHKDDEHTLLSDLPFPQQNGLIMNLISLENYTPKFGPNSLIECVDTPGVSGNWTPLYEKDFIRVTFRSNTPVLVNNEIEYIYYKIRIYEEKLRKT